VKVRTFAFVMPLLTGPALGQTNSRPYSREAAEKSFRTLVTAGHSIDGEGCC